MWIIPSPLLNSAPDMAALDLASKTSLANDCDASHIVSLRGLLKPISSVKWKKDSWMSHLFGTILRPSLTENFTDWWTSSLQDTLANRSLPQESEQERKTQDTCGLGSQTEFGFCDQECASSKMSKDISRWDSPASLATWKSWVTKCRGEYSARVKSVHLTNASGSSSWPTMHMGSNERGAYYDKTGKGQRYLSDAVVDAQKNWPTPAVMDTMGGPYKTEFVDGVFRSYHNHSKENAPQYGARLRDAVTCGLPAPANPSTHGSRQESLDQSQRNWQTFAHGTHNRGETPHRQVVKALVNEEKAQTQCLTVDQVFAEEIKGTNQKSWATPNNFCFQPPENTEQWTKRAEYQQTEKGVNLHKPIQSQVLHENEKVMGAMPPSAAKLNPRWVETLMGLPIGWTMPSCTRPVTIEPMNCDCLETESSQPPQNEHLELF